MSKDYPNIFVLQMITHAYKITEPFIFLVREVLLLKPITKNMRLNTLVPDLCQNLVSILPFHTLVKVSVEYPDMQKA